MSKRPTTAGSFLSRLRRPAGRLRDMPIWSKLGLIMIVPTIATVVVGTSGLVDHLQTLNNANRAGDLANLVGYSGDLVNTLQDERTNAVLLLGSPKGQAREQYQEAYNRVNQRVDQSKVPYSQQRAEIEGLPATLETQLDRIDSDLTEMPGIRSQVYNGKLRLSEAVSRYTGLINNLITIRDSATQLAGDNDLSDQMRAAAAMARAKEYASVRRIAVHQVLLQRAYTPALRELYISSNTGEQQALQSFQAVATRAEREFQDQSVSGSDRRQADIYAGQVSALNSDKLDGLTFTTDQWDAAMVAYAQLNRSVEVRLDSDVVAKADELRSDVQRQVFLETGLLLSMLLLAILFAYLVARSMARSLRELRQGALSIAQFGLPQAVARLRDPQFTGQQSPAQLANQIAEPLPVRSRDEFGQVTEAFNAVHLEAVRTAAEQAALRSSVATMFVNLARRSQILVDRLIGHLDRLERGEEDPDRLAELFQLDHLATRMRRNDENLLVLAGADSTRVQREPAALIDVLRAAQSEVEHYTRIEFGIIDRDIEVSAHAVNDLVHLVAELFDNATAFSPPDSQVMVEARRVGDRASLYVEDRGIGISAEQLADLNERLATPPQVDVAVSRMMGLVVVARLASRHGVKVELRPGTDRGTVAEVVLPTSVLVPRALTGRAPGTPGLPAAGPHFGGAAPAFGGAPTPAFGGSPAPALGGSGGTPAFGALPALGNGQPAAARHGESGNQVTFGGRPFDPAPPRNGSPAPANGGRGMPAWSDLTGAGGINGGDAFTPRSTNGQQIDPLPQRRSGDDPDSTGQQPVIPRQLPSSPEARPYSSPPVPPVSAPPLPPSYPSAPVSGQPVSGYPVSGQPASGYPVSGQPVSGYPVSGQPVSGHPVSGQPAAGYPVSASPYAGQPGPVAPVSGSPGAPLPSRPTSGGAAPGAAAPPAWPPVANPERDTATPPVPERLAAALDMTTELPRVPRTESAAPAPRQPAAPPVRAGQPSSVGQRPSAPQQAPQQRYADETMELPIFRELESAWFRTRKPGPEEAPGARQPAGGGTMTARSTMADPAVQYPAPGTTGSAPMAETAPAGGMPRDNGTTNGGLPGRGDGPATRRPAPQPTAWQTAADDGWRAAVAATEAPVAGTTQTGLPKRTPMAQLVPGAIEKPAASVQRRTPEAVRGLLSAYHRGVQRGRTTSDNPTNPDATPGGQQSSPSGFGPAGGSGQKEQEG
ncbi:nitrate- and nitrite sensing domain-containing protein [Micromonospora sp. WMMD714]|uniref:nitrate- and nitrite sensing domain-containing protein n=1 Tax=Micromonospora sp. WMMD714 TaxID=3016097 RepID=UPI00249CF311|nr:nitrate- and nitrite sensing domain-containing protein [Micromonospora sp. WMMD714]WFE63886.1 nitrate- and nitrite sensing domain-containing protein [Micromonospora sp. WMMD714]